MLRDNEQDSPQGFFNPWLGGTGRYDESMAMGGSTVDVSAFRLEPVESDDSDSDPDPVYIVKDCYLRFGLKLLHCADTELNVKGKAGIYAKIDHSRAFDPVLSVTADGGSNTISTTYVQIYYLTGKGSVYVDLRTCPTVPAYVRN